ncbi:MAG: TIGR00266 family protein [Gemmataceae bacterium]
MQFDIQGNPDVGELRVTLEDAETVWSEAGAMSRMSGDMDMTTRLVGGFFKAFVRKMVGGESLFVGEYQATRPGQSVSFSPACPGTILHRKLEGDSLMLTAGSYLACSPGLNFKTKFGGLKAFFSGESVFFIEVSGEGDLFFNSYGGIIEKDIEGACTVDTGHLVAWEPSLDWTIGGMGGIKQTLFSGEGLVIKFSGQGKVYLQTRQLPGIAGWLEYYC